LREPALSASCAILVDGSTGRVLYGKNPDEKRPIASITKLMTALVAVRSTPDLKQEVEVKREYTLDGGSSMYLKPGEKATLETLLYGLLLVSGNDAALAIADFCGGGLDTFVGWMNDWQPSWGWRTPIFQTPAVSRTTATTPPPPTWQSWPGW
jgi:D-alanyl-D-alanine carboxypeptidase (penicillin-binding protein 5/6)